MQSRIGLVASVIGVGVVIVLLGAIMSTTNSLPPVLEKYTNSPVFDGALPFALTTLQTLPCSEKIKFYYTDDENVRRQASIGLNSEIIPVQVNDIFSAFNSKQITKFDGEIFLACKNNDPAKLKPRITGGNFGIDVRIQDMSGKWIKVLSRSYSDLQGTDTPRNQLSLDPTNGSVLIGKFEISENEIEGKITSSQPTFKTHLKVYVTSFLNMKNQIDSKEWKVIGGTDVGYQIIYEGTKPTSSPRFVPKSNDIELKVLTPTDKMITKTTQTISILATLPEFASNEPRPTIKLFNDDTDSQLFSRTMVTKSGSDGFIERFTLPSGSSYGTYRITISSVERTGTASDFVSFQKEKPVDKGGGETGGDGGKDDDGSSSDTDEPECSADRALIDLSGIPACVPNDPLVIWFVTDYHWLGVIVGFIIFVIIIAGIARLFRR